MKVALVGLIQSGKSKLFSAISGQEAADMGATNIAEAVVSVPDERLDWLTGLYNPKRTVLATISCLDVPGFNYTDQSGQAAARRLINQVRSVDMFVMVVRAFKDQALPAYRDSIDPARDIEELQTEFLFADLEMVTTRIENLEKQVNKPSKTQERDQAELALQLKLREGLESNKPAATLIGNDSELELVRSLGLLTLKPIMVVVNIGEDELNGELDFSSVVDSSVPVIRLCAKLEAELAQLDEESRQEFMADLGITESAAGKFVRSCYQALGLISFLTVGADEVRAWPIREGITALDAAGKIHSDVKRGFIRAETMGYQDLRQLGDAKAMKAAGKIRLEGKNYLVKDGDIMDFRFNV